MGGALLRGVNDVGALDYQSNVGVGFTFNPSLNVTLSNEDLVINGLAPGTAARDSNIIDVGVSTNVAYGYNLSATVGNGSNATQNLVNGDYSFTPLSASVADLASFNNDEWGYSYSIDNGANWINGGYSSATAGYGALPLYTATGVKLVGSSDNVGSSVQFKIAAKAGATQASGEYTNVVNFVAVANAIPVTLYDAFAASGAVMVNGYYKMQDMTSSICNAAEGESWLQLVDTRDNKLYWVAKLADGHCWMTQNLDLDLTSGVALTSENTDLNDNSLNGPYYAGYSYDPTSKVASWSPTNTTVTDIKSWKNDTSVAYSFDPGEWYWDGDDSTPNCNYLDSTQGCTHFTQDRTNSNKHLSVGNYYNWSAAIASNGSSSLSDSTYNNVNLNPQNSICPKGWRLPTIANPTGSDAYSRPNSRGEFGRLNYLYNGGGSTDPKLISTPLWFVRSGGVFSGILNNPGSEAFYWSSTVSSSNYAYDLSFSATSVGPANNYGGKGGGRSVRCVAR